MRKQLLLALFLALAALFVAPAPARAATLTLDNSTLTGLQDDIVGWGFTIQSTAVPDGASSIIPWLLISSVDFVPDPGFQPVGVFNGFLTMSPEVGVVIGPAAGNGEVNPWSEPFDNDLLTGIGSYQINDFQSLGDMTIGNIVVTYDMYNLSPLDPDFKGEINTLAVDQTMSAATSVTVGAAGATVPEPGTGMFVATALLGWLLAKPLRLSQMDFRRRSVRKWPALCHPSAGDRTITARDDECCDAVRR
jgi:hypothetical protein